MPMHAKPNDLCIINLLGYVTLLRIVGTRVIEIFVIYFWSLEIYQDVNVRLGRRYSSFTIYSVKRIYLQINFHNLGLRFCCCSETYSCCDCIAFTNSIVTAAHKHLHTVKDAQQSGKSDWFFDLFGKTSQIYKRIVFFAIWIPSTHTFNHWKLNIEH